MATSVEALLGDVSRRFDDWIDDQGLISTRLTIMRADGVPETYEAKASQHGEARRKVCMLAYSAIQDANAKDVIPPAEPEPSLPASTNITPGGDAGNAPSTSTPSQQANTSAPQMPALGMPPMPFPLPFVLDPQQGLGEALQSAYGLPPFINPLSVLPPYMPMPPMVSMNPDGSVLRPTSARPPQPHRKMSSGARDVFPPGSKRHKVSGNAETRNPWTELISRKAGTPENGAGKSGARGSISPNVNGTSWTERKSGAKIKGADTGDGQEGVSEDGDDVPLTKYPRTDRIVSENDGAGAALPGATSRTGNSEKAPGEVGPSSKEGADVRPGIDDNGEDYVSQLNMMSQKSSRISTPVFSYERDNRNGSKASGPWICAAHVQCKESDDQDAREIRYEITARNKKDARKRAARLIVNELTSLGFGAGLGADEGGPSTPEKGQAVDADKDIDESTSINILFHLFQKGHLLSRPEFSIAPEDGPGANGQRWKCELRLRSKEHGEIEVRRRSAQKRFAKQAAALKAVEKLRELKIPGLDDLNAARRAALKAGRREFNFDDPNLANTDEMVRESDGEGDVDLDTGLPDIGDGSGGVFSAPPDFKVVIARSAEDCKDWVEKNLREVSDIGVYLDCPSIQRDLQPVAKMAAFDISRYKQSTMDCRVVSFSTKESSLLLCATNLRKNGCTEGKGCWIPSAAVAVLEDRKINKHGVLVDAAALIMRALYGVSCVSMHDLSVSSFALCGHWVEHKRQILAPIDRLVTVWLRQKFQPFSQTAIEGIEGLAGVLEKSTDFVCPAVYVALACCRVQECIQRVATAKRGQLFGYAAEFDELCSRLTNEPPT